MRLFVMPSSARRRWLLWPALAISSLLGAAGCGGGQALLHPAHTLPPGAVSAGAGVSGHFVLGSADAAIESARSDATSVTAEQSEALTRGSLAVVALAPGVSPWRGARVGVGWEADAGLTYTGRAARADARRAWELGPYALSAGVGATGIFVRPGSDTPEQRAVTESTGGIRGLDAGSVGGFGFDVPLLFGWRSDVDLVRLWVGIRGGYERLSGEFELDPALSATPEPVREPVTVRRWYGGALVGIDVGVGPIRVAAELDGAYHRLSGSLGEGPGELTAELDGFSLTPSGALITHF